MRRTADGIVYRDLKTRKWGLTSLGRLSLKKEDVRVELEGKLRQDILFMIIKEAKPDAWWKLVEKVAKHYDVKRWEKELTEEELMRNLKSYSLQTKHSITALWTGLVSDQIYQLGVILAIIQIIRTFYPSSLRKIDEKTRCYDTANSDRVG